MIRRSPYPCHEPNLLAYDEEPPTEPPAVPFDELLAATGAALLRDEAEATFRLQGVPFKTTTTPEVGKRYDLNGDGAAWLCAVVNKCRAVLHPVGQPSKPVSVSALAELREVTK